MMTATPYETLVDSGARLTGADALADTGDDDLAAATDLLGRNQLALETARRALGRHCVVPLRYDESFLSEHLEDLGHIRNLARVFQAEAFVAVARNDYQSAARIGIDLLDLANAVRRGGLIIDLLVSISISGIAMTFLRRIRTALDDATRLAIIRDLQRIESNREPCCAIATRDREWEIAVDHDETPFSVMSLNLHDSEGSRLSDEEQKEFIARLQQQVDLSAPGKSQMQIDLDHRILASMRMLVVELALRSFYNSLGQLPDALTALAPSPLPALPIDPYTNSSFIYRRVDDMSFDLYSPGPTLRDSGGRIGPWPSVAAGDADLFLDTDDDGPD